MTDLVLRTAVGNYGHTTPLKDGTVTSKVFDMEHIEVSPVTSIFRRMVRGLEFDVAEMALSTYLCARAHGKAFTGIPIFLTRAFYHGGLVYNTAQRHQVSQRLGRSEGRAAQLHPYSPGSGLGAFCRPSTVWTWTLLLGSCPATSTWPSLSRRRT